MRGRHLLAGRGVKGLMGFPFGRKTTYASEEGITVLAALDVELEHQFGDVRNLDHNSKITVLQWLALRVDSMRAQWAMEKKANPAEKPLPCFTTYRFHVGHISMLSGIELETCPKCGNTDLGGSCYCQGGSTYDLLEKHGHFVKDKSPPLSLCTTQ